MFNYLMLLMGLIGFCLVVWGPRRRVFNSGYRGNPAVWVVSAGFILMTVSAVSPLLVAAVQQTMVPVAKQVEPITAAPEGQQEAGVTSKNSTPTVSDKSLAPAIEQPKEVLSAIEVCESVSGFFAKNSCRFEQCEKSEYSSKPECAKYLKKSENRS